MPTVGEAIFSVIPEFKQFNKELFAGVDDAAKKASKDAAPVEVKADTSQIESAFKRLGDLGRVVAGIAVVAALKNAIDSGREWAQTVNNIARVSGDSLEESSRLAFVLGRIGINSEAAAPAIRLLNRNVEQGGANFKKYFDAATLAQLRTASFSERLAILSGAYQNLNTASERSTFVTNTFGRGQGQFAKLLELSADELKALGDEAARFGLILDASNAGSFKRFAESQRAAAQASLGLKVAVGELTLPVFEAFDKAAIAVLTTLTSLPAPVQTLIGVFAIGAIGIGKYAQTLTAIVDIGKGVAAAIARIVASRTAEVAGTTASAAAANLEAVAHDRAAAAAVAHAQAELALGGAASTAAAAQGLSGVAAAAAPAAAAAGVSLAGSLAAAFAAALPPALILLAASRFIINPLLDKLDEAFQTEAEIRAGNADRVAAIKRGGGGKKEIDEATASLKALKDEGKLTAAAMEALVSGESLKRLRDTVEAGGGIDAVLRDIVGSADDGASSFDDLGVTVGEFASEIGALRDATLEQKAAQADLSEALRRTGVDTEAGTNVLANYAQRLFEIKRAAAEAAGEEFDAGKARRESAEEALEAADDFLAREKQIAQAIADGREKIADAEERLSEVIADAAKRNADAQRDLAEAIADRTEKIVEAEERLKEVRLDAAEAIKDAQERLADAEVESAERVRDAQRRLIEATRARNKALTEAGEALSEARRNRDPEAEKRAQQQLREATQSQQIDDAERELVKAKGDREKQLGDLREDLARQRIDSAKDVQEAEKALARTIRDASERVVEAQRRVNEAATQGQRAIRNAQEAVRDANVAAKESLDALNLALDPVLLKYRKLRKVLKDIIELNQTGGFGPGFDFALADQNAEGGDLRAGRWSWTGEEGPELVKFGSNATVINNDDVVKALREMMSGRSGGSSQPIVINTGHVDERVLANEIAYRMGRDSRR